MTDPKAMLDESRTLFGRLAVQFPGFTDGETDINGCDLVDAICAQLVRSPEINRWMLNVARPTSCGENPSKPQNVEPA